MASLRSAARACAVLAFAVLSACASNGGVASLDDAVPGGPDRPRRVQVPSIRSGEYRRSWGLEVVDAFPAYAAGATGHGVTIAMIDVGLEGAQPEVAATRADNSIDLLTSRDPANAPSRHGGYVAGTMASRLNGGGTIGVAYDATILSIRADLDGRCDRDDCVIAASDIARGLDYAIDQGARVIVLAVQGEKRLVGSFEAALARVSAAGAVVVVAAGNDFASEPSWPARYAADERFAGTVIAVGAVNNRGQMPRWSNRAGASIGAYLVAPGQRIVTDCDDRYCSLVSGTSFATPYVAGAIALVMQAHPQMTARDAGAVVLRAARDLGRKGPDAIYGQGLLDIGRAMRLARERRAAL